MPAIGLIGHGSVVEVGRTVGSNTTFTPIVGAFEMTLPNPQSDKIDVTHYGSGGSREFISGLSDNGEATVTFNWVPASATDTLAKAISKSGEAVQLRFKVGKGTTANTYLMTETWDAVCTGFERNPPNDDKLTATLTFAVGAEITTP